MTCTRARKLLSRTHDGHVAQDDATLLEQHLTTCGACRRAAAQLRDGWRALDALAVVKQAPDDWSRIERTIDARRRSGLLGWWTWDALAYGPARVGVVAVMAVLGAGGGGLLASRALPPRAAAPPLEVASIAEAFSDLPWDSPALALDRALSPRQREEVKP